MTDTRASDAVVIDYDFLRTRADVYQASFKLLAGYVRALIFSVITSLSENGQKEVLDVGKRLMEAGC
jgi:hypothetical protein